MASQRKAHSKANLDRLAKASADETNSRRRQHLQIAAAPLLFVLFGTFIVEVPQASAQTCPPFTQGYWKNHQSVYPSIHTPNCMHQTGIVQMRKDALNASTRAIDARQPKVV